MSIWHHLTELIRRLRIMLIAIIVSTVFVMLVPLSLDFASFSTSNPFYPTLTFFVINDLQQRFLPSEAKLLPISPIAPLEIYMFLSVILGVVLSSPVIAYELYKFINPALYKHERKSVLQFVIAFAGLFIFGFMLGYFFVIPVTMRTLFSFSSLLNLDAFYSFSEFFSIIGLSLLVCGLIFTFPTYIVLLVKVGILQTRVLTKNRKYMYGGTLIIIALIDPDPSIVTEALLFIPIVILMEISIVLAKRIEKAREKS